MEHISNNEVINAFSHIIPYLHVFMDEEASIAIADTEKYLINVGSAGLSLESKSGDPIPQRGAAYIAIKEGRAVINNVPKEVYGTAFKSYSIPVRGVTGDVEGCLMVAKSLEKREELLTLSRKLSDSLKNISDVANGFSSKLKLVVEMNNDTAMKTEIAQEKVGSTDKIFDFINDVANQTDMLGINASIEATRAGADGRGFKVIAQEIRNLSQTSKSSVYQINHMLGSINKSVEDICEMTAKAQEITANYSASFSNIAGSVEKLNDSSKQLEDMAGNIGKVSISENELKEMTDKINIGEKTSKGPTENETLNAFDLVMPYLPFFFDGVASFAITDTEKNLHNLRDDGKDYYNTNLTQGGAVIRSMKEGHTIINYVPAVALKSYSIPVRDKSGIVEGCMVVAKRLKDRESILQLSRVLTSTLEEISNLVGEFTQNIQAVAEMNAEMARKVDEAKENVGSTDKIFNYIHKVSSQTDLLGINASIEATRPEASGRGFDIISQEIRNLSQTSRDSVDKIYTMLNEIKGSVEDIFTSTAKTQNITEGYSASFTEIAVSIEKLNSSARELELIADRIY